MNKIYCNGFTEEQYKKATDILFPIMENYSLTCFKVFYSDGFVTVEIVDNDEVVYHIRWDIVSKNPSMHINLWHGDTDDICVYAAADLIMRLTRVQGWFDLLEDVRIAEREALPF